MKFPTSLKRIGTIGVAVALVGALAGCSGGGATAATVNGTAIKEETVTNYIQDFRESADLMEDSAWAEWMATNNYTPETVRDEVINYYVQQELYNQAAKELNVTVSDEDINAALEEQKSYFEDDAAWQEALEASNMTEDEYKETVLQPSLLQEGLAEAVAEQNGGATPTDDELLAIAQEDASYFDGSKRSSHILFNTEDAATAQQVLDQLNAGEIDFADAAEQYSTDTGSAQNGGDVGWDALTTFVTEYQDAVDGLEVGQISGLVESEYGIHIITVTDEYNVPEEGIQDLSDMPEDFQAAITEVATSENSSGSFTTWYEEYEENATIEINPMPSGLPYDIDMSQYVTEDTAANETVDSGDASFYMNEDGEIVDADGNVIDLGEIAEADTSADDQAAQDATVEGDGAAANEAA